MGYARAGALRAQFWNWHVFQKPVSKNKPLKLISVLYFPCGARMKRKAGGIFLFETGCCKNLRRQSQVKSYSPLGTEVPGYMYSAKSGQKERGK